MYLHAISVFSTGAPPVCHLSFVRDRKSASRLLPSHSYQWSFPSCSTHQCCRLPGWGDKWVEICMCRLCEKDAFHTRPGNSATLEFVWRDYSYNEVCFTRGECSKHIKYAQWKFFFIERKYLNGMIAGSNGKIWENPRITGRVDRYGLITTRCCGKSVQY